MSGQDHVGLWNRCLEIIRDNVPEQTYKTWFLPIVPLKYEDKIARCTSSQPVLLRILEDKFVDLLRKTLYKVIGEGTKLMYNVMVDKSSRPEKTVNYESTHRTIMPQKQTIDKAIPQIPVPDLDPHLNPEYNFDTFIEGYSNKLSRSVAEAVALNPAKTIFNPLFLVWSIRCGKNLTLPMPSVQKSRNYIRRNAYCTYLRIYSKYNTPTLYVTIRPTISINFYQTIDILIIDDIQEFAGVTKTQNTFFHIFNHLHQNGKQLILTSDRAPVLLQGMEERLITRFKWGMVAELEKPTVELRKNILRNKIHRDGLQFPQGSD